MTTTVKQNTTDRISMKLSDADAKAVAKYTAGIRRAKSSLVHDVLKMGELLAKVKRVLQPYGGKAFAQFLNGSEVLLSRRTAEEYIHAFESFGAMPAEIHDRFCAKAMYRLSAPSAPDSAAAEAIGLAKQDIKITDAQAKRIIRELKALQSSTDDDEPLEPWNEPQDIGVADGPKKTTPEQVDDAAPCAAPPPHSSEDDRPDSAQSPTDGPQPVRADANVSSRCVDTTITDSHGEDDAMSEPTHEVRDEAGHRIDHLSDIVAVFEMARSDWDRMIETTKIAEKIAKQLRDQPIGDGIRRSSLVAQIGRTAQIMSQLRPYSVCARCHGQCCQHCSQRGWVNETVFNQAYTDKQRRQLASALA